MKLSRAIPLSSIIVLIVLGCAVYSNSLAGKFIWDDSSLIVDNSFIKNWSNVADVFIKGNISTYTGKTFHIYRPLQIVTYMIDYSAWGLNPIGYHITNVLLHLLAALCLYWLISLIFSDKFISFVTAALFLAHPIHTEAVSYISGRADPLAVVFAMLCLVCYVKYAQRESFLLGIIVVLTYAMSILSRENVIVLPLIMIVYNYLFRKKVDLKLIGMLALIALSYVSLRLTVLNALLPDFAALHKTTVLQRVPGFFVAIKEYVRLLVWPQGLHMEYGDKIFNFVSMPAIVGAIIITLIIYCAIRSRRNNPAMTFALLWFLIAMLPVSNLYPIGAYMAEHWLYLPSIGLFLAVALVFKKLRETKYLKIIAILGLAVVIGGYSYLTIKQNLNWREPVDFYKRTLKYSPGSTRVTNDLAIAYEKEGMHDEATGVYNRMLKEDPVNPDVYVNLAAVQIIKGNAEDAIALCKKAIELEPGNATAHNNIAVAYYVQGEYDLAIKHCDLAIKYGYKVKNELITLLKPYRQQEI